MKFDPNTSLGEIVFLNCRRASVLKALRYFPSNRVLTPF